MGLSKSYLHALLAGERESPSAEIRARIEAYVRDVTSPVTPRSNTGGSERKESETVIETKKDRLVALIASLDDDTAEEVLREVQKFLAKKWAATPPSDPPRE